MRKIAILILLFISAGCFAQENWINIDSIPYDSTIIVSLAGKDSSLKESQIHIPLTIQARDTTIKILQFRLGYVIEIGDHAGLREQFFMSNKGFIDKSWGKMYYETRCGCGRIFIDNIVVEKNGRIYSAKAFIIPVQMRARTLKELKIHRNGFS